MNAIAPSPEHLRSRRAIAAHFAGRATPATEAAMRAHLSTCADCRHRYDRHLILARLDPRAPPVEERLAAGLGFQWRATARWDRWSRRAIALAIPVAATALLLAFLPGLLSTRDHVGSRLAPEGDGARAASAFAARGGRSSRAGAPSFWTYRITPARAPQLAGQTIAASDELAFAYSNPAAKPYLMIFGVDEDRHVYWFHPAWPAGQAAPVAIPASAGPGPHELSAAIRHAIEGRRLDLYAVFSDRALATTAVEAQIHAAAGADGSLALGDGTVIERRTLRVLP
jgi:putative zinc finger protein